MHQSEMIQRWYSGYMALQHGGGGEVASYRVKNIHKQALVEGNAAQTRRARRVPFLWIENKHKPRIALCTRFATQTAMCTMETHCSNRSSEL